MKILAVAALSGAIGIMNCTTSYAADIGVAGTVGYSSGLRLPIRTQKYIVEPFVDYYQRKQRDSVFRPDSIRGVTLGVGAWKILPISQSVKLELGASVGYVKESQENGHGRTENSEVTDIYNDDRDIDGWEISPGIGAFYMLNKHIEAGLEFAYNYSNSNVKATEWHYSAGDGEWEKTYEDESESSNAQLTSKFVLRIFL